jgi:hypothetical protein
VVNRAISLQIQSCVSAKGDYACSKGLRLSVLMPRVGFQCRLGTVTS